MNQNFNVDPNDGAQDLADPLEVPPMQNFKDIHAGSPLPSFSKDDIELYLALYQKDIVKADRMYQEGYLEYVRYCNTGIHLKGI